MSYCQCVACGVEMMNIMDSESGLQPNDGLAFSTRGHYGSTYFDPMNGSYIELAICDECVKRAVEDGRARIYG